MNTRNGKLAAFVVLLLACGCGRGGRLESATVSGTVTLDGTPLGKGAVIFTPEMGRAATGAIQQDGSYTLGTYKPGDGVVLGKHRVSVLAREEVLGDGPMSEEVGPSLIPEFYGDSGKSGLSFAVKANGGRPIMTADMPWEDDLFGFYGTVLHDGQKFRMWYHPWAYAVAYAESDDGLHWRKPTCESKRTLKELQGQPICLRICLQNAIIYAFQIQP